MILRLIFLLAVLLPGLAVAQQPAKVPPPCFAKDWEEVKRWQDWNSHMTIDHAAHWAKEAVRIGKSGDVWRSLDRLYLKLDDDRLVMLTDCPFTDSLYFYLYEGYDTTGRFHVVRTLYYEDTTIALVMKKTGTMFNIPALPIWSPDRSRFAYSRCDMMNGPNQIAVMRIVDGKPILEAEASLPCATLGDCRLAWESASAVSATCQDYPQNSPRTPGRQIVRLDRESGGWKTTVSGP